MYGKLDEKVREFLISVNEFPGTSDDDLVEIITEAECVHNEHDGSHRWWDDVFKVVKIGDRFIGFTWAHCTGDRSLGDTGWEFDLSSVSFCEPYEVTITKYRNISDVGKGSGDESNQ